MAQPINSENPIQVVEQALPVEVKELFNMGMQAYRKNELDLSLEIFQNIAESNPEMPEAHINLGDTYFKLDKIDEAIGCWKKALGLDSSIVSCYINLGNAYYATNNINEALSYWITAVMMAPDHTVALMNIGAAYEKLGDNSVALKYYEQFLKFSSDNSSWDYKRVQSKVDYLKKVALHNFRLGINLQKKDDLRGAVMAYMKSIDAYPNLPKAHLNLGSICYKAKKYDKAIQYWQNAAWLVPAYDKCYCNLGVAYEKLEQFDYAYCMYRRYLNLAESKTEAYDIIKRSEDIKKYLEKHSELSQRHLSLAEDFYKKKKHQEALWEYENYIMLSPEQASAYEARISELKDYVNPAKKAARMAYEVGNTCFEQKNYDKAIQAFRRSLYLDQKGELAVTIQQKITECVTILRGGSRKTSRVK